MAAVFFSLAPRTMKSLCSQNKHGITPLAPWKLLQIACNIDKTINSRAHCTATINEMAIENKNETNHPERRGEEGREENSGTKTYAFEQISPFS